MTDHVIGVRR